MDLSILLEILKYLSLPGFLTWGWKRWIRIRVTTHLGCVYERRSSGLAGGVDPNSIFVQSTSASAVGPEHLPPEAPYREALFVRIINRSERDITVHRVWVETSSGDITVNVPGGQQVVEKDHLWETCVPLEEIRRRIANARDYYTSVRVRVLQSRRRTWHSAKADDSEVGVSGDLATTTQLA